MLLISLPADLVEAQRQPYIAQKDAMKTCAIAYLLFLFLAIGHYAAAEDDPDSPPITKTYTVVRVDQITATSDASTTTTTSTSLAVPSPSSSSSSYIPTTPTASVTSALANSRGAATSTPGSASSSSPSTVTFAPPTSSTTSSAEPTMAKDDSAGCVRETDAWLVLVAGSFALVVGSML